MPASTSRAIRSRAASAVARSPRRAALQADDAGHRLGGAQLGRREPAARGGADHQGADRALLALDRHGQGGRPRLIRVAPGGDGPPDRVGVVGPAGGDRGRPLGRSRPARRRPGRGRAARPGRVPARRRRSSPAVRRRGRRAWACPPQASRRPARRGDRPPGMITRSAPSRLAERAAPRVARRAPRRLAWTRIPAQRERGVPMPSGSPVRAATGGARAPERNDSGGAAATTARCVSLCSFW